MGVSACFTYTLIVPKTVFFFLFMASEPSPKVPTYLKYMGHNRSMQRIVVGAAAVQVFLLALLAPGYAATGTALAYPISMCGMYLAFSLMARRELVILRSGGAA